MQVPERSKGLALGANAVMRAGSNPVLHTKTHKKHTKTHKTQHSSVGRATDCSCKKNRNLLVAGSIPAAEKRGCGSIGRIVAFMSATDRGSNPLVSTKKN